MRLSTILFSTVSLMAGMVSANPVVMSPRSDPLALDISPREVHPMKDIQQRDLLSVAEGLLSEINVTSIIDSIDWEGVAGFANNILTENNNVQYLDDLLNFVGDTDLVGFLISYIISNNSTREIAYDAVLGLLANGNINLEPVFVALKNSGLAYDLIADLIENPNTLPFIEQVVKDLFSGFSLGSIFGSGSSSGVVIATTTGGSVDTSLPTVLYSAGAISGLGLSAVATNGVANSAAGGSGTGNINTAQIASLISQAATEGTNAATSQPAQVTAQVTLQPVATQAATTKAAATVTGNAAPTSYNFATITGPAFQSLPPSQFGQGPTTINYSVLGQLTAVLGGGVAKRNDAVEDVLRVMHLKKREEEEIEKALALMKRDNIEDLLTTIFSSVGRSNILNTTIEYLVTDSRFESSVVYLLQGLFSNLGSTLSGVLSTDWSSLAPLVNALLDSGLLTDLITRAFNDPDLKAALVRDFESLFKRELLKREEFPSNATLVSFTTSANSSFPVITYDSENVAGSRSSNFMSIFAVFGLTALMI